MKNPMMLSLVALALTAGCDSQIDVEQDLPTTPNVLRTADSLSVNEDRPNILFIMTDDHAVQALSAYGHPVSKLAPTPNIDRIAENGVKFARSYVTNSICGPSRASMFTGKFSHKNGFAYNGQIFDGTQFNWVNTLQRSGYTTAVIGKWHINRIPDGFEFDHWEILNDQGEYYNPDFITQDGYQRVDGYTTDLITEKTLDWLANQRDDSKPFALLMHHKAPHRNWMPAMRHTQTFENTLFPLPDNFFDSYQGRIAAQNQTMTIAKHTQEGHDLKMTTAVGSGEWREDIWPDLIARLTPEQRQQWDAAYQARNDYFNTNEAHWSEEDIAKWKFQRYMQDYLATIRSVDESVGQVLDYLEQSGLDDNTLVVYTSDQGFFLGEHGFYDKRFMYEESFSTPLLMQWPNKIQSGQVIDQLVQNIDYAPTFLELAGVEIPHDVQGRSLLSLVDGSQTPIWRSSLYYHYYEMPGFHDVARHYGVTDGRFKLMHFYHPIDYWEFYDLASDPKEMQNKIDDQAMAEQIQRMSRELERLQHQYEIGAFADWHNERLNYQPQSSLDSIFPSNKTSS